MLQAIPTTNIEVASPLSNHSYCKVRAEGQTPDGFAALHGDGLAPQQAWKT